MKKLLLSAILLTVFAGLCAFDAEAKPLKIYILVGQSNMQGHAKVTTFDHIGMDPKTAPILKEMRNADGSPRVCDKVWISAIGIAEEERHGKLTVGYGAERNGPKIGPEFTFGIYMQKFVDEPILIIKTAWGGKSLNTDFRPPSAGPYEFNEAQLENLKKRGVDIKQAKADKADKTGHYYRLMIKHVKGVLGDIKRVVPDYDAKQGYELAGFAWFQGWNDKVDSGTYPNRREPGVGYAKYGVWMADFIRDVRKDLNAPKMPFVIGVMGVGGMINKDYNPRNKVTHGNFRAAMAAPTKMPEFKGNVVAVRTGLYWDPILGELAARWDKVKSKSRSLNKDKSLTPAQRTAALNKYKAEVYTPEELELFRKGTSNAAYHYLGSAKIMAQIGKAFAEALAATTEKNKSTMDPDALKRWQDMGFGMFIHWGPVSLTGHEIGWSRGRQTPIEEYDQLYKRFNPTKFDADQWVRIAKDAGMKYMVLTTKHHDGFCLWPSKHTDYHIGNSPFKRDVVGELAKACKKQGIKFGTYYSVCDWYHPAYPKGSPAGQTDKPNPDIDRYIKYLRNQVTELITNYGPLHTMWFDVPQEVYSDHGDPTIAMVRKLQPDILINNRAYRHKQDHNKVGDYSTPEQRVGGFDRQRPWETCMTICRQWAWKPNDKMKSAKQCIQTLLQTVGGDGNLLFNVGPMPDGLIEPRQVERLKEMGTWLKKYGYSVYGTRGGPFKPGQWGASTCKGNKIYLFVMNWPQDGSLKIPAVGIKIKKAKVKTGGTVKMSQTARIIEFDIPKDDRDPIATVIELTVKGKAFEIEPVKIVTKSNSAASGKQAKASHRFSKGEEYAPGKAFDDDPETRWATPSGTKTAWLQVDLGKEMTIDRALINEGHWDRVKNFALQYKVDSQWKTAYEGRKIDSTRSFAFDPVTAHYFRLNIFRAVEGPTIWEFQLFEAK